MSRRCTICDHPERAAIELRVANGESYRAISRQYRVSRHALARHVKNGHIVSVVLGPTEPEVLESTDILHEMTRLRERARAIEKTATKSGDHRMALGAIREQSRIIENLVKLAALLKERVEPTDDTMTLEQWRELAAERSRQVEEL